MRLSNEIIRANRVQLSDLAFQRHILVQALILIDFMLSLTENAKQKVAHITTQKALQYEFTLSEEGVSGATATSVSGASHFDSIRRRNGP